MRLLLCFRFPDEKVRLNRIRFFTRVALACRGRDAVSGLLDFKPHKSDPQVTLPCSCKRASSDGRGPAPGLLLGL